MPDDTGITVDYAGVSVASQDRDTNEDAWTAFDRVSLFVVADGSGTTTTSGRIAADAVVQSFRHHCGSDGGRHIVDSFAVAAADASEKIRRHRCLSATLAALRIEPPWTVVTAIGACRVYRYRNGVLERLTMRARKRFVGGNDAPDVHVVYAPLRNGDLFLLTSDGVTRKLDNEASFLPIIGDRSQPLESRCDALVAAASARDSTDDITAVLVEISMSAGE